MKEADLIVIERALASQGSNLAPLTVGVLSPSVDELDLLKRCFPFSEITSLLLSHWNIENGPCAKKFDLLVIANVFMASQDVGRWIKNALASCKNLLIQDSVRAWRGGDRELGDDGDHARFSFPLHGNVARIDGAYDMTAWSEKIEHVEFYDDDPGFRKHDGREMDALKFVAFFVQKDEPKKKPKGAPPKMLDVILDHDDSQGADVSKPGAS